MSPQSYKSICPYFCGEGSRKKQEAFEHLKMEQTMLQLENRHSWKDSLRRCCRINKLTIELASAYTPLRFRSAYARFKAIYQRRTQDKAERWLQNQLKAFEWFVVALSLVSDMTIRNFGQKEIEVLNNVFYFKQPMTLLYEVRKLSQDPTTKNSWDSSEEALLKQIVQEENDSSNRWNEFARKLYEISEKKYFRTGKQCRQKWLNHLDPNKKHGEWTQSEDMEVAKLFLTDGRKWSQVSKKMGGSRTEHMVKNRYKTIVSRQKKIFPDIRSQYSLLKTFVSPQYAQKCANKVIEQQQEKVEKIQEQQKREVKHLDKHYQPKVHVKAEQKSAEEYNRQKFEESGNIQEEKHEASELHEHKREQFQPLQGYVREEVERPEIKSIPQTSNNYQPLPQVFSPWYMGYPMTPTFSPFFVNVSTFSAFDSTLSNQFYAPTRHSQQN